MTQEDRQLLLLDLSARLPYGIKGAYLNDDGSIPNDRLLSKITITYTSLVTAGHRDGMVLTGDIKPYLLPLSSMTKELEFYMYFNTKFNIDRFGTITPKIDEDDSPMYVEMEDWLALYDWFNKNHIDYRGLIEKGLAIDATGLNIY